jgi:hypothetical protein
MPVTSGAGPHLAWVTVNGQIFPVEEGTAQRAATRRCGGFSGSVPIFYPGAEQTFTNLGDNTASISVQTLGATATLITGEIDDFELDYIGGGIHFTGRDASAKLHANKSAEKWVNKKPHEIIQDIAGRIGLPINIDQSIALLAGRQIEDDFAKLTDGVSYGAVVHKLSEFMGAHWFVDQKGTLNVKIGPSTSAPYIIKTWRNPATGEVESDALQMRIRRNVQAGKSLKVTVNSWHQDEKKAYTSSYTVGGNGSTQVYSYHLPGLTEDHVKQHAKSKANDHARHEIAVMATLVGDVSLTVDQPLQIVGTALDQTLSIDSISDSFGMRGHTMQIAAKSAKTGRSGSAS